jgi:hypothetical protein
MIDVLCLVVHIMQDMIALTSGLPPEARTHRFGRAVLQRMSDNSAA